MGRRPKREASEPDRSENARSATGRGATLPGPQPAATKKRDRTTRGLARRRLAVAALGLGVALLLACVAAPQLLRVAAVRTALVRWTAPQIAASLSVGSMHAGWLTSISASDITLRDSDGRTLATVAQIASADGLWHWLVGSHESVRHLQVNSPQIALRIAADGSHNAQSWLDALAQPDGTGAPTPRWHLEVTAGSCSLHQPDGPALHVDQIGGTLQTAETLFDWRCQFTGQARVPQMADPTTTIDAEGLAPAGPLELTWGPASTDSVPTELAAGDLDGGQPHHGSGTADGRVLVVAIRGCPWQWWLAPQSPLRGVTQALITARPDLARPNGWQVEGTIETEVDPGSAAQVRPELGMLAGQVAMQIRATFASDRLDLEQLAIRSPLGNAQGMAHTPWDPWRDLLARPSLAHIEQVAIAASELQVTGDLPLDRWSVLPAVQAWQGREVSARVSGAALTFALRRAAANASDTPRWSVQVQVGPGQIDQGQGPFSWNEPMAADLLLATSQNEIWVEEFTCQTPMLVARGTGTPQRIAARFETDLTQLVEQLGPFLPVGIPQLSGRLQGEFTAEQTLDPPHWQAVGQLQSASLSVARLGTPPWQGHPVKLELTAAGSPSKTHWNIEQAQSAFTLADGDSCTIRLMEPWQWRPDPNGLPSSDSPPGSFEVTWQGDLGRWQDLLQVWHPLPAQVSGPGHLAAQCQVSRHRVELVNASLDWQNCRVRTEHGTWQEPRIQTAGQGGIDLSPLAFQWRDLALTSTTLALRAQPGEFRMTPELATRGEMQFRGDVARLIGWFLPTPTAGIADWQRSLGDQVRGQLQWDTDAPGPNWRVGIESLPAESTGSAPRTSDAGLLQFAAAGHYQPVAGLWRIDQVEATLPGLELAARTERFVDETTAQPRLRVEGETQTSWERLVPLAMTRRWGLTDLRGQQRDTFRIELPWPSSVAEVATAPSTSAAARTIPTSAHRPITESWREGAVGEFRTGWSSAELAALPVGPGVVQARLAQGILGFDPIQATLGDGRLTLSPTLDLRTALPVLALQPPTRLEHLSLTPEVCHGYLRFVAPMLSEVAESRGQISVDIERARLTLDGLPSGTELAGQLVIHHGTVGPGPLSRQILEAVALVKQVTRSAQGNRSIDETWIELPSQQVPWQVRDGRVHHEGLTLQIGDVTVKSQGSVGLDETVQMVITIPVRPEWVAAQPWLQSLEGQSLQLPVRGTLRQPMLDRRGLAEAGTRAVQGAARDAVRQEVQKQLLRLFDP